MVDWRDPLISVSEAVLVRRRPQPNRGRGLLRAAVVVVVLTALLLAGILIVASLTAPKAQAPIVPPTPGHGTPILRGSPQPTPRRATPTTKSAHPTPASTPKKDVALRGTDASPTYSQRTADRLIARVVAPHKVWSTWFSPGGDAYHGSVLYAANPAERTTLRIGEADRFVHPVWSPNYRSLLFVHVEATSSIPGARWTLLRYDRALRSTTVIARVNALSVVPLGWSRGRILYMTATSTDTSLYAYDGSRVHFISILIPQPVDSGLMSPGGSSIVIAAPADCSYCTMDVFSLEDQTLWNGPSGIPSQYTFAWTQDGHAIATVLAGRLATVDTGSHATRYYSWPTGLPSQWHRSMEARFVASGLVLTDMRTGLSYRARPA